MALTERQIDNRFAKREKLLAQIAELEEQVKTIDNEMKAECLALGVSFLYGEKSQVRFQFVDKASFDSARFKAEQKELYKAYTVTKQTRPFYFEQLSEKNRKAREAAKMAAAAGAPELVPVPVAG